MDIYWEDTEKTILIQEVAVDWDWCDYQDSIHNIHKSIEEANHDVFLIIDCRRIQSVPKGILSYFNEISKNVPKRLVMCLMVSPKRVLRTLALFLTKIVPESFEHFSCAPNMEKAHLLIAEAKRNPRHKVNGNCD